MGSLSLTSEQETCSELSSWSAVWHTPLLKPRLRLIPTTDTDTPGLDMVGLDTPGSDTMARGRLRLTLTTDTDTPDLDTLVLDMLVLDTPDWDTLVWDIMAVDTTLVRGKTPDTVT